MNDATFSDGHWSIKVLLKSLYVTICYTETCPLHEAWDYLADVLRPALCFTELLCLIFIQQEEKNDRFREGMFDL